MKKTLTLILFLVVGAGSTVAGAIFDQPSDVLLWNSFSSIRVVDSFAVAAVRTGLVALQFNARTEMFMAVDHLLLSTEPVTMKVSGEVLLVRSAANLVYFVDLSNLPFLTLLGQIDPGYAFYDCAMSGQDLYIAAGFDGLVHYRLENYAAPVMIDSSLAGVHCVQVEIFGSELLLLDDYNGLLAFDVTGGNLGEPIAELLVPRRALSFVRTNAGLAIPLVGRNQLYWGEFGPSGGVILDSLNLTAVPQQVLAVDTLLVMLDPQRRFMELCSTISFAQLVVFLPPDLPQVLDGDVFAWSGDSYLVHPSPDRGLSKYNLEDVWFDPQPRQAYLRPGPVNDVAFHRGWLVSGGDRNPLEFYSVDAQGHAVLDTALLGLNSVGQIADAGDVMFVQYPPANQILAMRNTGDSIKILQTLSVPASDTRDVSFVPYPPIDSLDILLVRRSTMVQIYGVTGDWHVRLTSQVQTFANIMDAAVVDSFLVLSTEDHQLHAYRLFGDLSALLWWTVSTPGTLRHLVNTGPRIAHEGWEYPSMFLAFDGAEMYEVYVTVTGFPTITHIATLPAPVTASARGPRELYTVGERGTGVIDLGYLVPQMVDYGGFAGDRVAFGESSVAVTDGEAVYLYTAPPRVVTEVEEPETTGLPGEFLLQNYPNPFNPETVVEFVLPAAAEVDLSIFNIMGQRVVTLLDRELSQGRHAVRWNGTDSRGTAVASGVYIYKLTTAEVTASRKMLLVR